METVRSRLTVVETIYHQQDGQQPLSSESKFNRMLDSDEQPYVRQLRVGEDWQRLDTAWVKECSTIQVINQEGVFLDRNPTDEERETIRRKVILLRFGDSQQSWLIHPTESMRGCPEALDDVWIKCQEGTARVIVHVIPK